MLQVFLIYIIFGVFGILLSFLFFQFFGLKKRLDILSGEDNKGLEATLKILLEKSERNEKDMKVKELIKTLKEYNPNAVVYIWDITSTCWSGHSIQKADHIVIEDENEPERIVSIRSEYKEKIMEDF